MDKERFNNINKYIEEEIKNLNNVNGEDDFLEEYNDYVNNNISNNNNITLNILDCIEKEKYSGDEQIELRDLVEKRLRKWYVKIADKIRISLAPGFLCVEVREKGERLYSFRFVYSFATFDYGWYIYLKNPSVAIPCCEYIENMLQNKMMMINLLKDIMEDNKYELYMKLRYNDGLIEEVFEYMYNENML